MFNTDPLLVYQSLAATRTHKTKTQPLPVCVQGGVWVGGFTGSKTRRSFSLSPLIFLLVSSDHFVFPPITGRFWQSPHHIWRLCFNDRAPWVVSIHMWEKLSRRNCRFSGHWLELILQLAIQDQNLSPSCCGLISGVRCCSYGQRPSETFKTFRTQQGVVKQTAP